jgi:putative glutamine amidotransferase
MQPIIGITMCFDDAGLINKGVDYSYIRREYATAVQRAGGEPIFLDPSIDPLVAAKLCDGIVISGGQDIDPTLYHEKSQTAAPQEPRARTDWENRLIDACDEWSRPILGICYGEQLLNVHYGGTLYQDISHSCDNPLEHGTSTQAAHHAVTFMHDFADFKMGDKVTVTARHHQAVHQLAPGFRAAARADDGCIEAIIGNGHMGVQWHAESDKTGEVIYNAFIQRCLANKQPAKAIRRVSKPRALSDLWRSFVVKK